MKYTKKDLGKNSLEFVMTIDKADIAKHYDIELEKAIATITVEGFRIGKAPRDLAEKQVDRNALYETVINVMLPPLVTEIVKKENLKPIVNPQIKLNSAKEGEDWSISVLIAERPTIKLPDYKKLVKDLKNESKKDAIWVPGKDKEVDKQKENEQKSKLLNAILDKLLKDTELSVADFIIESEVNRKLSMLIDDVRKLGMTLESYLQSKGITNEQLRASTHREIEETYKLEMILDELAEKVGITVSDQDTKDFLKTITDEAKRLEAEKNMYYYTIVLRRQKLIDFLTSL